MSIFTNKTIHTILSLPIIGGILTLGLTLIPAFLFLGIISMILPSNSNENSSVDAYLAILFLVLILMAIASTWWWLNYLERKINVSVILPIPFVKIPVKWLLYPFMLPIFGIKNLYRHFFPKTEIVKVNPSDREG